MGRNSWLAAGLIFSLWAGFALAEEINTANIDAGKPYFVSPKVTFEKGTEVDQKILRVEAVAPCRITVARFEGVAFDQFVLKTSAKIRTELKTGSLVLETLVRVGDGFYFSRALDQQLTEKTDWKQVFTNFHFKKGERPDEIFVDLIFEGSGTAWIREIKVETGK